MGKIRELLRILKR